MAFFVRSESSSSISAKHGAESSSSSTSGDFTGASVTMTDKSDSPADVTFECSTQHSLYSEEAGPTCAKNFIRNCDSLVNFIEADDSKIPTDVSFNLYDIQRMVCTKNAMLLYANQLQSSANDSILNMFSRDASNRIHVNGKKYYIACVHGDGQLGLMQEMEPGSSKSPSLLKMTFDNVLSKAVMKDS